MKTEDEKVATIAAFSVSLADLFLTPLLFAKLWAWFLVPLGAVTLTYATSFGVMIVLWFLGSKKKDDDPKGTAYRQFASHTITFAVGAIAHAVMV